METELRIKNMVCDRCILVVDQELQKSGYHPSSVALGRVTLPVIISQHEKEAIASRLHALGFELIDDKRAQIVEEIKTLIIELIHYQDERLAIKLSNFLAEKMQVDYASLSAIFSAVTESTIEKYFILQKIEKVKELLVYDELTLSEIAYKLHYSSVAHLSNQFKKIVQISPSQYRQEHFKNRKPLDQVL